MHLKHPLCKQPVTLLLLSPCPQSSGGGRASGTRPGAAEEEVCETAERKVSDAVIRQPPATKCWVTCLKECGSRQIQEWDNGSSFTCCQIDGCGFKSGHLRQDRQHSCSKGGTAREHTEPA